MTKKHNRKTITIIVIVIIVLLIGFLICGFVSNWKFFGKKDNKISIDDAKNMTAKKLAAMPSRDNYANEIITKNVIKKCSTRKNWNTIDDRSKKYLLLGPFSGLFIIEKKLWKKNNMDHDVQTENLKLLKDFLEYRGIQYFIDCGTLLGAVRDKNIIKGDTDADIQITQEGLDKLREDIKELEDVGFIAWRNQENGSMGLSLLRNGEYVDFYRTFVKSGAIKNFPFNLVSYPFLGTQFPVPEHYEEYLTEIYGNWKIPSSSHDSYEWDIGMPKYIKKYGKKNV